MPHPTRCRQGRQPLFGKRIAIFLARRSALHTALLAAAIAIGAARSTVVVQAQDGGTGSGQPVVTVTYAMRARLQDNNMICVGQTRTVSVVIERQVSLTGAAEPGAIRTRWVALSTSFDSSILSEGPRPGQVDADTLIQQDLEFKGIAPGRTLIDIHSTISDSVFGPVQLQASVSVQVVPCSIHVKLTNRWSTMIEGSAVQLQIDANDVLNRGSDGSYKSGLAGAYNLAWVGTVNRFRGCLASRESWTRQHVSIEGRVRDDDRLELTFTFQPLTEGGVLLPCDTHSTGRARTCADNMDGVCTLPSPNPTFAAESLTVDFPLNGGSQSVRQRLNGSTAGTAVITVTPRSLR